MNTDINKVTWIAMPRKGGRTLPANLKALRVRTGFILDERSRQDGSLECLVYLEKISGPLDHPLNDKIWVAKADLTRWAAHEWQHYDAKTPFEIARAEAAAERRRDAATRRRIRRIAGGGRS